MTSGSPLDLLAEHGITLDELLEAATVTPEASYTEARKPLIAIADEMAEAIKQTLTNYGVSGIAIRTHNDPCLNVPLASVNMMHHTVRASILLCRNYTTNPGAVAARILCEPRKRFVDRMDHVAITQTCLFVSVLAEAMLAWHWIEVGYPHFPEIGLPSE